MKRTTPGRLEVPQVPFAAIDFETANAARTSACQIGVALVDPVGRRIRRVCLNIRPPTREFGRFESRIHGLRWEDVEDAPDFSEAWPKLQALFDEAEFLVAHNAGFDRTVLHACCRHYALKPPQRRWVCTVELAKALWPGEPARLNVVAKRMGMAHQHHDAGSDAEASARVVLWAWGERAAQTV